MALLAGIEQSLVASEVALQDQLTSLLETQAAGGMLTPIELGGALAHMSDTLAGQRKARAGMLTQLKVAAGASQRVALALPSTPSKSGSGGDRTSKTDWEFRTLQRVRSLMVREVASLDAKEPVDQPRVASIKADIDKLSNALCELMAQPQGTPSRQLEQVVRKSLDGPASPMAVSSRTFVAAAKPAEPSPTVTPPDEPLEAGAMREEASRTPQVVAKKPAAPTPGPVQPPSAAAAADPLGAPTPWESPLAKLLSAAAFAQAPPTENEFNNVIVKIMSGPTPRKVKDAASHTLVSEPDAPADETRVPEPVAPAPVEPETAAEAEVTVVAAHGAGFDAFSPLEARELAAVRIQAAHRGLTGRRRHHHHIPVTVTQTTANVAAVPAPVEQLTEVEPPAVTRRQLEFGANADEPPAQEVTVIGGVDAAAEAAIAASRARIEAAAAKAKAEMKAKKAAAAAAQEAAEADAAAEAAAVAQRHQKEEEAEEQRMHEQQEQQELERQRLELEATKAQLQILEEQQREAEAAATVTAAVAAVAASAAAAPDSSSAVARNISDVPSEPAGIALMISVLSHTGKFQKRQRLSGVLGGGTIADVKALIERRAGLKSSLQRLRLDDQSTPLDTATLEELGLNEGSHLALLRPTPKPQAVPPALPSARPTAPVPLPERTSSSGSENSPKPSAFAVVAPARGVVTSTPTRHGRAQQLLASQMMMSPMLSPIRATPSPAGTPLHGNGSGALAEASASLDEAIATIDSEDDLNASVSDQDQLDQGAGPGMLTWPSPGGRVARTISDQIDNSPAAREFEADMQFDHEEQRQAQSRGTSPFATLRREAPRTVVVASSNVTVVAAAGGDGGSSRDARLLAERERRAELLAEVEAEQHTAAVRIQAASRGRRGRTQAQMLRQQVPQPATTVKVINILPAPVVVIVPAAAETAPEETLAPLQQQQPLARCIRRQLQFEPPLVLMVAVPQPGDPLDDDGTSPFSPSPFDGETALLNSAGSGSLLPPPAVIAVPSATSTAADLLVVDVSDEQAEFGEGSTDSFSPSSTGPTPPKLTTESAFYSARDAVEAPEAGSGLEGAGTVEEPSSPKPWVGSLTVAVDPTHTSPGPNKFRMDQELKRSSRKARKDGRSRSRSPARKPAATAAVSSSPAPSSPAFPKPHKLSEVIGALWPQWVGQYGLVTGPSSMGIVDANADDLALEPWRGDSDIEEDENLRCWVWDEEEAKARSAREKRYQPKGGAR